MLLFNLVKTWTTTKWSIGMRLSNQAIGQIKQTVKTMLGDGSRVSVFGSRLDDNAKGGDIDLLIETDQAIGNEVALASRLSACLQIALGDQKIDVIVLGPQTVQQSIHQHAKQTAVAL